MLLYYYMSRLSWKSAEYVYRHKTSDWYWTLGIVTATAAILSILLSNTLFGLVIVLSGTLLGIYTTKQPRTLSYEINERGVVIENTLYPFNTLEAFCIDNRVIPARLLIKSHKLIMPLIVIPIEGVRDEDIRKAIAHHLYEEEQQEPFLQQLFEGLGF